jgi:hypothetical protein
LHASVLNVPLQAPAEAMNRGRRTQIIFLTTAVLALTPAIPATAAAPATGGASLALTSVAGDAGAPSSGGAALASPGATVQPPTTGGAALAPVTPAAASNPNATRPRSRPAPTGGAPVQARVAPARGTSALLKRYQRMWSALAERLAAALFSLLPSGR